MVYPRLASTNLLTILTEIKAALVYYELFTADTVYIGLLPDVNELMPSTTYCVVSPDTNRFINYEDGTVDGEILVTLWSYVNLDVGNSATIEVIDPSVGLLAVGDKVAGLLQLYDPIDLLGENWLLAEPMRLTSFGSIYDNGNKWAKYPLRFDIKYGYLPLFPVLSGGAFSDGFSSAFLIN
jgi:hypothetical protein